MIAQTYEDRLDMIVTCIWKKWTKNGLGLDDDMRSETERTVQDAANNVYIDNMNDVDWLAATLRRLTSN